MTNSKIVSITIRDKDGKERTVAVSDLCFIVTDHEDGHGTLTAEFVETTEAIPLATGYYARQDRPNKRGKVHAVEQAGGGPICGAHPTGEFQWTHSAIECERCRHTETVMILEGRRPVKQNQVTVLIHEW